MYQHLPQNSPSHVSEYTGPMYGSYWYGLGPQTLLLKITIFLRLGLLFWGYIIWVCPKIRQNPRVPFISIFPLQLASWAGGLSRIPYFETNDFFPAWMRAQVLNSVRADCCLGLLTDIKVTGRRAGNAYYTTWLVVWNMNFIFPYLGNFIIPTDELSYFSEGLGSTTKQQPIFWWYENISSDIWQ